MLKQILFIFSMIMCINILSAQVPSIISNPTYTQYTNVTIPLPCTIGGEYCSLSAICNATIINPTNVILVNGANMQRNGVVFEINLTDDQTSEIGEYQFNVVCSDTGSSVSRFLKFNITPTGSIIETPEAIFYIIIMSLMLALILICLYQVTQVESYGWVLAYVSAAYIILIPFLFIAWRVSSLYIYNLTFVSDIIYTLWWLSMILFFPYILVSILWLLGKAAEEDDLKKYVNMGYTDDEAKKKIKRKG
jgi:hypothetical protein